MLRDQLYKNIESAPLKLPVFFSENAKKLVIALLTRNPLKRLGAGKGDAEEIKQHPWFHDIDWKLAAARELKPPKPVLKKIPENPKVGDIFANQGLDLKNLKDWSFVAKR